MSSFLKLVSSVSKTQAIAACAATSFSATIVLYSALQSTGRCSLFPRFASCPFARGTWQTRKNEQLTPHRPTVCWHIYCADSAIHGVRVDSQEPTPCPGPRSKEGWKCPEEAVASNFIVTMGIQNIRSTLPTRQPLHTELCHRSHSPKYACPHCCTEVKDEANVRRACSRVFFRASEVDDVMLRVGPKCDEGRRTLFFLYKYILPPLRRRGRHGRKNPAAYRWVCYSNGLYEDPTRCCEKILSDGRKVWHRTFKPRKVLDARMYSWHPLFCPIPASPARVL